MSKMPCCYFCRYSLMLSEDVLRCTLYNKEVAHGDTCPDFDDYETIRGDSCAIEQEPQA